MVLSLLTHADYIVVCVKGVLFRLNYGEGHIGAMISHTLEVCQQIIINKADVNRAYTRLQTLDMVKLHFITHFVDMLLQRLNTIGKTCIISRKSVKGKTQDLINCL